MKLKEFKQKFLTLKGEPKYIAKGVALGTFVGMTPTPGFQVLISLGLAKIFNVHKLAAALSVFNTNAVTGLFVFAFNYYLGSKILGLDNLPSFPTTSFSDAVTFIFNSGINVFLSLIVGGVIVGIPSAIIMYFVSLNLFTKIQRRIKSIDNDKQLEPNEANEGNYTVITGAGAGLGKSIAEECAGRKMNLILISLPNENLVQFSEELKEKYKIDVVALETDLSRENSITELSEKIIDKYPIDMLINNAGVGGSMAFEKSSMKYLDTIIMVNVRATALLTRMLLPELKKRKKAYILNVASMASFGPLAFKTVYPASKAFIYSFSRGLTEELKGSSVFLSVIHPGPMMTNKDVTERIKTQGFIGQMGLLPPEKVAKIAINRLLVKDSLVIPGTLNKVNWIVMKITPTWLSLYLSAKIVKREFA